MKCFTVILTDVVICGAPCCSEAIGTVPAIMHIAPPVPRL